MITALLHLLQSNRSRSRGFTLIELLVVFSILSIIAAISIASFVNYSRTQALKTAGLDIITLIQQAKSRAQTQVKPTECAGNGLQGYEVRFCGLSGSSCGAADTYEMAVVCGSAIVLNTHRLPDNISFTDTNTTSTTFRFLVVNGGVEGAGTIAIEGFDLQQIINVTEEGAVSTQ